MARKDKKKMEMKVENLNSKSNWKKKLIFVFVSGASIYLSWKHSIIFLSYLKVGIWPVVVLIFISMFKPELAASLTKLISIDTPLGKLTLSQENQKTATEETAYALTAEANVSIVATATATLVSDAEVTHVLEDQVLDGTNSVAADLVTIDSDTSGFGTSESLTTINRDELTKESVEKYIKVSAEWGYNMALIGFSTAPIPEIDWVENQPQIKFGTGSLVEDDITERVLTVKEQTERDTLIREILGVRKEINGLSSYDKMSMGLGPSKENVLKFQLRDLKKMLSKIDSTSIFLLDDI